MPIRTFPERDPQTKFTMNFYLSSLDLRKGIIRSVIAVLLGVIFLIAPDLLPNTLVIILGATILFVGIVSFLNIFSKDGGKAVVINYFNLALSLIVGIVLLVAGAGVLCGIGQDGKGKRRFRLLLRPANRNGRADGDAVCVRR